MMFERVCSLALHTGAFRLVIAAQAARTGTDRLVHVQISQISRKLHYLLIHAPYKAQTFYVALKYICGCEFNAAAAGGAIAGAVLGHFSPGAMLAPSAIVHWRF